MGARREECCDTILEESEVVAAARRAEESVMVTGVETSVRIYIEVKRSERSE